MVRKRALGLTLAVAFAVSLVASASAVALPEFTKGVGGTFTIKGGKGTLEIGNALKTKLICESLEGTGMQTTATVAHKINLILKGCKIGTAPCKTPGAGPETIEIPDVTGKLGYINKANKEVGILFTSEEAGKPFDHYVCESGTTKITASALGSLICPITPVNKPVNPTEHFMITCKQSKAVQSVTKFEGETHENALLTNIKINEETEAKEVKTGLEGTGEVTPSEESEISA